MYAKTLTTWHIETAAQWWAGKVCAPAFDGLSRDERQGGEHQDYELAEVTALMLVQPIDNARREDFIDALKDILASDEYRPSYGLHVDYHPGLHLAQAAEAAGIPATNFPWKTDMYFFDDGSIETVSGYAGPRQRIDPPELVKGDGCGNQD